MATQRKTKAHTRVLEHSPAEKEAKTEHAKPTKPKHYRKTAQEVIEQQYRQIVTTLATEATKGSVRHTKLLFDLGGVQEEVQSASPRRRKSPSLGRLLLKEAEDLKRNKQKSAVNNGEAQ